MSIDLTRYNLKTILPPQQRRRIQYLIRSGRQAEAELEAEAAIRAATRKRTLTQAACRFQRERVQP